MRTELIAFTQKGCALGERLSKLLLDRGDRAVFSMGMGEQRTELRGWTAHAFAEADALVFIGAAGIAVRAIAPHLVSKASDPAVVVLDDNGRFCLSLLSGHLGGANELAEIIAGLVGAMPVITTATDGNAVFAVDSWAKSRGIEITNPERIKIISAKLLAGETVALYSDFPITGKLPHNVALTECGRYDIRITAGTDCIPSALHLVPPAVTVGIGCRRGTSPEAVEAAFGEIISRGQVDIAAVKRAATIDIKKEEAGILELCNAHDMELCSFTAGQLNEVEGSFAHSDFVKETTGTDNVCERSAVLASGGRLLIPKTAGNGITMALAVADYTVKFEDTE